MGSEVCSKLLAEGSYGTRGHGVGLGHGEILEAPGPDVFGRDVGGAWHDVKMNVLEAVSFSEASDVLLIAREHASQSFRSALNELAQFVELAGFELVKTFGVAPKHDHEPSEKGGWVGVLDLPEHSDVHRWSRRNATLAGVREACPTDRRIHGSAARWRKAPRMFAA